MSNNLVEAPEIREQLEGGAIESFAAGDDLILDAANDWLVDHGELLQSIADKYPTKGFILLEYPRFLNLVQTQALGNGKASALSEWVGQLTALVDEWREVVEFRGQTTDIPLGSIKFSVRSLLESMEGRWFVRSHEVVSMQVETDSITVD